MSCSDSDDESDAPQIDYTEIVQEETKKIQINLECLSQVINLPNISIAQYTETPKPNSISDLDPIGTVVYYIASRSQIVQSKEPYDDSPLIFAWSNMKQTTDSEYPIIAHDYFKNGYKLHKKEPNFHGFINPSIENVSYLESFRHDYQVGRAIFHYIGVGFPHLTQEGIYGYSEFGGPVLLTKFRDLFTNIHTPSIFIFDCENAGIVLDIFKYVENQLTQSTITAANRFPIASKYYMERDDWTDWFCFCATNVNEKLPVDPLLPRDFLTACLITPVPLAILCHILHYYRTTFKTSPLDFISSLLKNDKNSGLDQISEVLASVTECVASDYLTKTLFMIIFRHEPLVRKLFQHFILAQFLLNRYSVHPISHPYLPPMWNHSSWVQWETTIDMWISHHTMPSPFTSSFYFHSIAVTFASSILHGDYVPIKMSLLTGVMGIPLSNDTYGKLALVPLARYAAGLYLKRKNISSIINFPSFMDFLLSTPSKILESYNKKTQYTKLILDFHSLCYVIFCALYTDISILIGSPKNIDLTPIINIITIGILPLSTRTLATAVLAILLTPCKSLRTQCTSTTVLTKISNSFVSSDAFLTLWYLLLLKRAHGFLSMSQNSISHRLELQINMLLFHNSSEVRAASISALSLFCTDQERTARIMYSVFIAVFDCSFIVRNQILLFVVRCLISHTPIHVTQFTQFPDFSSIDGILSHFYHTENHFSKYIADFASFVATTLSILKFGNQSLVKMLIFIVEYLCYDPVKIVRENAIKMRDLFSSKIDGETIAIPLGMQEGKNSDFKIASLEKFNSDIEFPSDNDSLFYAFGDQLVNSGMWQPSELYHPPSKIFTVINPPNPLPPPMAAVNAAHCNIMGSFPLRATYLGDELVVATNNKSIYFLNDELRQRQKIQVSQYETCDLQGFGDNLIICTTDGCVHIWNEQRSTISFRASAVYQSQSQIQLASPSPLNSAHITTARGTSVVSLWDLNIQKLVGEWTALPYPISAIQMDPFQIDICYFGCANGTLASIDFRLPMTEAPNNVLASSGIDRPLRIGSFLDDPFSVYSGSSGGKVICWDTRNHQSQNICSNRGQLASFTIHRALNVFITSPTSSTPWIHKRNGDPIIKIMGVPHGSIIAAHQSRAVVSFVCQHGEIYTYQLTSAS